MKLKDVLDVPQHRIIVKSKRTGGAFGGKERMMVALMTGVAAHATKRPCRFALTREVDTDITGRMGNELLGIERLTKIFTKTSYHS